VAPRTPAREELQAAYGREIPDLVAPDLRVLLVGINPSLWSGWSGVHFGRQSNRLWPTLHEAGLTPRRLVPEDTDELLDAGIGITNLVNRATARADELTDDEIRAGVPRLRETVRRWRPRNVAVLGVTAYRTAFGRRKATVGRQDETLEGARVWVLPNPSGLNAHYQQPGLTAEYAKLAADIRG
jgi:double-stranded uracil-DNA glycosylase